MYWNYTFLFGQIILVELTVNVFFTVFSCVFFFCFAHKIEVRQEEKRSWSVVKNFFSLKSSVWQFSFKAKCSVGFPIQQTQFCLWFNYMWYLPKPKET